MPTTPPDPLPPPWPAWRAILVFGGVGLAMIGLFFALSKTSSTPGALTSPSQSMRAFSTPDTRTDAPPSAPVAPLPAVPATPPAPAQPAADTSTQEATDLAHAALREACPSLGPIAAGAMRGRKAGMTREAVIALLLNATTHTGVMRTWDTLVFERTVMYAYALPMDTPLPDVEAGMIKDCLAHGLFYGTTTPIP